MINEECKVLKSIGKTIYKATDDHWDAGKVIATLRQAQDRLLRFSSIIALQLNLA
jgi:hypothetical protein